MGRKLLILQFRGFGDAVITTSLIEALHKSNRNVSIDVWASEQVAPIFDRHPSVNRCYAQALPVMKRQRWGLLVPIRTIGQLLKLRGNEYDIALNMVGDIRENFLTSLVGAKRTWSVIWEDGHPIRELLRPGLSGLIEHNERIPTSCRNIYELYGRVAAKLLAAEKVGDIEDQEGYISLQTSPRRGGRHVGIHPFASQPCREWTFKKWNALINRILVLGYDVTVFGAVKERGVLEKEFKSWLTDSRVSILTAELSVCIESIGKLTAFVGLDSFGVHAARANGVPVVMINGANDPSVWAPPGAQVVGDGGGCEHYPCYNRPRCLGNKMEYACIKSISVEDVVEALMGILPIGRQSSQAAHQEQRGATGWS